jgi:hypothetical protein
MISNELNSALNFLDLHDFSDDISKGNTFKLLNVSLTKLSSEVDSLPHFLSVSVSSENFLNFDGAVCNVPV